MSAKELTKSELSSIYDIENEGAASLLSVLNISDVGEYEDEDDDEDDSYLTDTQREKIEFANKLKALGINEEDLEDFQEFKRQKEAQKRAAQRNHARKPSAILEEIEGMFGSPELLGGSSDIIE